MAAIIIIKILLKIIALYKSNKKMLSYRLKNLIKLQLGNYKYFIL